MTHAVSSPKYLEVSAEIEAQIQQGQWDGGRMPSVRWVAQQYKVSAVTASRALQVLRDKGLIQTVERSGCYRVPPPSADRWAVVLRVTPGPWLHDTLGASRGGFEALARREPIHLETDTFPLQAGMPDETILALVKQAKERGVRGIFLLPSRSSDQEMRLDEALLSNCRSEAMPVVFLERYLRGHNRPLEADLVSVDDLDGAARCTRHLLERGRKRVAFVVASPTSSHNDRLAGYLYALHAASNQGIHEGKPFEPIVLHERENCPTREAYADLADQITRQHIDGVVCYVDYTAVGLMVELLSRGVSVPKDVAVVGFDDLPIGTLFGIGVTSYSYPAEVIATQALRLMRERLAAPDRPPIKVVVPGRLVIRDSTGGPEPTG